MKFSTVIALLIASGIARGAQSPSEAAVAWLRHVAAGEAETDLADETALSPDTSAEDLKTIRKRIMRLRDSLRPDDLKAVADKEDGDLAAVLVSQISNYDANSVQIHAVGLVKDDGKWVPAPLPSSFNSTGLSLRPGFLQRAKKLEDWMLRNRSAQLVRLKDDAFALLSDEMKKAKVPDDLQESTPEELAGDFLAALAAKDLPAALAMTGGLESPRPADFDETFQTLSRILRKKSFTHPEWRLLAAPEAIRAIVSSDRSAIDGLVNIVALDPAGNLDLRPHPRAIHLPLVKSKAGTWRIRLPYELLAPEMRQKVPGREMDDDIIDADLLALFPGKLSSSLGTQPAATPRDAAMAIVLALQAPSLKEIVTRMDLAGEFPPALDALDKAARLWQRIHHPRDAAAAVLLDVHEEGDDACALLQMFSSREPAKASIETVFFHRRAEGWLAVPSRELSKAESGGTFGKRIAEATRARNKDWSAGLLTKIGGIAADSAPTEEEARAVVTAWRQAIAAGDFGKMLSCSACFDDEAGANRLLKNSGYELVARQGGEILAVHRSGRWAAATLRVPPAVGDDSAEAYPLVVVAATSSGPRVLPELDLFDPLTRSRKFLNRSVWDRVAARLPDGARGELESIFEEHRTLSAANRERRPKPTE